MSGGPSEITADLSAISKEIQGDPQGQPEKLYGGKCKSVEELEAAFLATQQPPNETPPSDNGNADGKSGLTIDEDGASDALTRAGLSMDDFSTEFAEKGALSEDSYKKLADAGFPKDLVEVYVDGLRARTESYENAVFAAAGGKDGYPALIQWAAANLSAEQKRAFNEAVQSGDAGRAALAVQGVVALRGGNPRLLNGKSAPNADAGVKPFRSIAEVVAAQRDPRYRRDPAYRKDVEARLRVSDSI